MTTTHEAEWDHEIIEWSGADEVGCSYSLDGELIVGPHPAGRWFWEFIITEHFISGPYPGTPDWHEHHLGEGDAPSRIEAMWQAERCRARWQVRNEVEIAEEEAFYAEWSAELEEEGA